MSLADIPAPDGVLVISSASNKIEIPINHFIFMAFAKAFTPAMFINNQFILPIQAPISRESAETFVNACQGQKIDINEHNWCELAQLASAAGADSLRAQIESVTSGWPIIDKFSLIISTPTNIDRVFEEQLGQNIKSLLLSEKGLGLLLLLPLEVLFRVSDKAVPIELTDQEWEEHGFSIFDSLRKHQTANPGPDSTWKVSSIVKMFRIPISAVHKLVQLDVYWETLFELPALAKTCLEAYVAQKNLVDELTQENAKLKEELEKLRETSSDAEFFKNEVARVNDQLQSIHAELDRWSRAQGT